ncbi:hypothetical protein HK100_002056 [Physocladia obscura]|uniref:Multiple myeloma tumor-associated protein 2-like N-terminal domain-containing protein n=1 Tax=Physocladia obscura TaxID=109957 RepID=A0AAD5XEG1_9FUNG|nr:hypothetical protein HK100_002056 [Physocladia obscura]
MKEFSQRIVVCKISLMFNGPIRAGNRGGNGLFRWDNIKDDKHRENYLGHSINAPVGRWQKGKDLGWYGKETKETNEAKEATSHANNQEVLRLKQLEADAMAAALGLKAKRSSKSNVSQQEIVRLLKLDKESTDEVNNAFDPDSIAAQKGLGFGRLDTATFKPKYSNDAIASDDSEIDNISKHKDRYVEDGEALNLDNAQSAQSKRKHLDDNKASNERSKHENKYGDNDGSKKHKKDKKEKKKSSQKEKKDKKEKKRDKKHSHKRDDESD